jgi:SAM-dependent methyltransferase
MTSPPMMVSSGTADIEEFNAVFSNAVLHWSEQADEMIAEVHRSLRPGERLVAECGGFGRVEKLWRALAEALQRGERRIASSLVVANSGRLGNAP